MGDFNCHFGSGNGPRAWGVTTRNAAKLIKVINRKSLYAADLESLCSGPTYTFHVSGVGTSYIDHCVVSKRLSCNIVKCAVIDDDIMNTSDHLAISVDIKANLPNSSNISNDNMAPRVAWGKFSPAEIHDLYTAPVERELHNIYTDYMLSQKSHETPIDDLLQRTIECIINTANRNLPKVQFSKTIKPYWSDVLANLNETQKVAWRRWVTQGRPRDMNNTSWLQYKEAKRCFRAALRDAEKRYDRKCIDELCNSQTVDHKYFWRLINKHKKIKVFTHATLDEDSGTILYEPQKIRSSWLKYFQRLYKPIVKAEYDSGHKITVEDRIDELLGEDFNDQPITFSVDEIMAMCRSLKKNKAAGWDSVTAEHFIYGDYNMYNILTLIFNHVSSCHKVPTHFKRGIIVPIPKGRDKDTLSKDNYRGISLLAVVSKIYEKLLLNWLDANSALEINGMQGACVSGSSCLSTSFMLRETISRLIGDGNMAFVCLLDARKAFDTVWHRGLFYKLASMGCNKHLWHILWNFYQGFLCSVHVAGGNSEWFAAEQGVHQGGPLSMKLYVVFNSDLLDQLNKSRHGVQLSKPPLNMCCPAYADDISLVALHRPSMQALLSIVYQHSLLWRYDFNPTKSHVLVIGGKAIPKVDLYLGCQQLAIVSSSKHLGIPLTVDSKSQSDMIEGNISKGRRSFHASLGLGSRFQPVPHCACPKYIGR